MLVVVAREIGVINQVPRYRCSLNNPWCLLSSFLTHAPFEVNWNLSEGRFCLALGFANDDVGTQSSTAVVNQARNTGRGGRGKSRGTRKTTKLLLLHDRMSRKYCRIYQTIDSFEVKDPVVR